MIGDMVRRLVSGWGRSPQEINTGDCSDFAESLFRHLVDAGLTAIVSVDSGDLIHDGESASYWHVWIYHDGRHYDAEAPDGVSDWEELPFFVRWRADAEALGADVMYRRCRRAEDDAKAFAGLARSMARHQEKVSRELSRQKLARHLSVCPYCKAPHGCGIGDELLIAAWG